MIGPQYGRLNVDEAGRRSGLSGPTISRIESGKRGITVDEVGKLLDTYQVPVPLEEDYEIAAYQDTASKLEELTLGADDSVALIEQVLREMA